jgi:hypothetical protein
MTPTLEECMMYTEVFRAIAEIFISMFIGIVIGFLGVYWMDR